MPYLIRTIGETGYGVYTLIWSLLMGINQFQNSLQSGVVKYSAAFLSKKRVDEVNHVVSSSFVYSILLAVVASICIFVIAGISNPISDLVAPLFVVGGLVMFIIPLTPYIAIIQSRQHYYVGVIAETASRYLSIVLIVVWFSNVTPSVGALIIIMAFLLFLSRLVQIPVAYKLVPGLKISFRFFNIESFKQIASFGAVTVLAAFCLVANSTGVRWLMGLLISTSFVAHLAIMLMPGTFLMQIMMAMTVTIMPAASAFEATGNHRMLQELLIRSMRYITILTLACMIAAILLMKDVLNFWVGPEYIFLTPYALILFISIGFWQSTSTAHHILKGMGELRTVLFIYFLGLVLIPFFIIIILLHVSDSPYIAVTGGIAIGYILCGSLQIIYGINAVHIGLWNMSRRVYFQPLIVAIFAYLITFGIITFFDAHGLIVQIVSALFSIFLFLKGCHIFIATKEEKEQIKVFLQHVTNKFSLKNKRLIKRN